MDKLYIVLTGLPARGKSTVAMRLYEGLNSDDVKTAVFNNGELRRLHFGPESSLPEFYRPDNEDGRDKREKLAILSARSARAFLAGGGAVAILDATNASPARRGLLREHLSDHPIVYIECINDDAELLDLSVRRKTRLPEFAHLSLADATASFMERIGYYQSMYVSPKEDGCYLRVDTLRNVILDERMPRKIPHYIHIRDVLVSDWVRELYLARHGQSRFNVEGRIGGDSSLTELGSEQAKALAAHFNGREVPYIFTSLRLRACETVAPIAAAHPEAVVIGLNELDEIDAGVCDSMRYTDIRTTMPEEFAARARDKYNYVYPAGEGYLTMRDRVERGFRKALFLSGGQPGIVIVGHQAVNRTILSLFLYRRKRDVPYIYVPQDQCFHIVATHRKKLLELVRLAGAPGAGT